MVQFIKRIIQAFKAPSGFPSGGFRFIGGQLIPYKTDKLTYIEKGYSYNDIIFCVINRIVEKAIVPQWGPYKVVDEKAYFTSRAMFKDLANNSAANNGDFSKAMRMYQKAIVKADDEALETLIKYPNENDTWADLQRAHYSYKLSVGDYFEAGWESGATGGLTAGTPRKLYTVAPQWMSIIASNTLPLTATGYLLQMGTEIPFTKEDILHERYFNPEWDIYGHQLYGMSPIKVYLRRLQRNNMGQTRNMKAAENGGADDIVFIDDDRLRGDDFKLALEQTTKLKKSWYEEQGGVNNAGKAVWSPYRLGNIKLTLSPKELMLLDQEKFDLTMAALLYNAPPVLFSTDASTYNNMENGERALVVNCAIPLNLSREASLNRKLQSLPRYRGRNIIISPDLSCYTELQANRKDQVEWLNKSMLPVYRWYEILGEDRPQGMTDEMWNAIPVPSGTQLFSDLFVNANDLSEEMRRLQDDNISDY
jgi:phage portal protein BeeE